MATPLAGDQMLRRIDVSTCLSAVFHGLSLPLDAQPVKEIAELLGSVHLMRAVIELGVSIPIREFEATEDVQTAYLVALHIATRTHLLQPGVTLGLLTGRGGEVDLKPGIEMEAYARNLFTRPWLSNRHARAFCNAVDHAIRACEFVECDSVIRCRWATDMLTLKGYGPGGRHNFYSALLRVPSAISRAPLIRALAEFDLLPYIEVSMTKGRPLGCRIAFGTGEGGEACGGIARG